MRYSNFSDVVEQGVIPALGWDGAAYDAPAIARAAFDYRVDTDEAGRILLDTGGFEQVCGDEEFWAIVARHEIGSF